MRLLRLLATTVALTAGAAEAATAMSPTRAPAYPLAVSSPYLNVWLQGDNGGQLPGSWPRFWTGQIQGWQGFIAVDGTVYNWIGAAPGPPLATQVSVEYTSTRTIFTLDVAGKVTMTVTFLSPVSPGNYAKQSQQFSYITTAVRSADGASHSVQVYFDVSGELASGKLDEPLKWDYSTDSGLGLHRFYRVNQKPFAETGEIASWGNWFLVTKADQSVTQVSGFADDVRASFASQRVLANSADTQFRNINDRWPVFAFAKDFGTIDGTSKEWLLSIGIVQDEVISFQGEGSGMRSLKGLWTNFYPDELAAVTSFYNDYGTALSSSIALDDRIQRDSVAAAGQDYAAITTLSVRQTFGAMQFAASGQSSNPYYVFLKEISSNSDIQTVDVMFPALPLLLYLDANLTRMMMDPLFENQESGHYPNKFAIHDLGTFPNARGYPNKGDEEMPLEECGNMLIMTLAYAQRTGDTAYLTRHYSILAQWSQFLVDEALIPATQLSTDDFAGTLANQTNLALKGILGLGAMSQIARLTGNEDKFGSVAKDYLAKWQDLAINKAADPPHAMLSYNNPESHGLLYNLYADRLLKLNMVPQSVYDMQSAFYPTVAMEYGVPLDTRHVWTKSDWQLFCAAIATPQTRDLFVSRLAKWIATTPSNRGMTDLYQADSGAYPPEGPIFVARPVQGGTFALLALQR